MLPESIIFVLPLAGLYFAYKQNFRALTAVVISLLLNFVLKFLLGNFSLVLSPSTPVQLAFTIAPFLDTIGWLYALLLLVHHYFNRLYLPALSGALLGFGIWLWIEARREKVFLEHGEIKRKVIHTVLGAFIALVGFLFGSGYALLVDLVYLAVMLLIPYVRFPFIQWIVDEVTRKEEEFGSGAVAYLLGAIPPLLFGQVWIVAIMALADGLSTIFGKLFGVTPLFGKKTFEGTAIGFIAALAVARWFFDPPWLAAIVYTVTELLSPIDDNLTVPAALTLLWVAKSLLEPLV